MLFFDAKVALSRCFLVSWRFPFSTASSRSRSKETSSSEFAFPEKNILTMTTKKRTHCKLINFQSFDLLYYRNFLWFKCAKKQKQCSLNSFLPEANRQKFLSSWFRKLNQETSSNIFSNRSIAKKLFLRVVVCSTRKFSKSMNNQTNEQAIAVIFLKKQSINNEDLW